MNVPADGSYGTTARQRRRLPYWFGTIAITLGLLMLIWAAIALDLSREYNDAERDATMETGFLARVLDETLTRSMEAIDSQLRLLRELYAKNPDGFAIAVAQAESTLKNLTVQIGIVDAAGLARFSNLGPITTPIDLSDREHFRVHRDKPDDFLFISKPVLGRVSGRPSVQFARKLLDTNGAFAGIIVISLDTASLVHFRETINFNKGSLLLVGLDGVIRSRAPAGNAIGHDISASRLLTAAKAAGNGAFRGLATEADPDSFTHFRRLDTYGLIVATSIDARAAFADYNDLVLREVSAAGFVSFLFLAFAAGLVRHRHGEERAQLAREESDARVRGFLAASPDALIVMDIRGHIVLASDRVADIFGYAPAELIGQAIETLMPGRHTSIHRQYVRRYFADPAVRPMGGGLNILALHKDGREFPAEVSLSPYTGVAGQFVIATARDVTRQREAEQALRRWSDAFQKAAFGLSITDAQSLALTDVNPAYAAMHGMTVEEARSLPILGFHAPEEHGKLMDNVAISDRTGHAFYEITRVRKDGSRFLAQISLSSILDDHGVPLYRIASMVDITAHRQAEAEARRWTDAFEYAAFGISITDADANVRLAVNPAFAAMHGTTVAELRGHGADELYAPEELPEVARQRAIARRDGQTTFEATRIRRDGSRFIAQISLSKALDSSGKIPYRVATLLDVTDRRHLEERLRQTQKMEAIGQLTAGIAHDFNNLLGAIVNNQDLIVDEVETDPQAARRHASDTLNAALSGAEMVKRLLAFARQQSIQPKPIHLETFLPDTLPLLRGALDERIIVSIATDRNLAPILADPALLENVLLNLVINARDAMSDGGKITIAAHNTRVEDDLFGETLALKPGDYVMIAVSDTGSGMSAEVASHAFEPFFTTKGVGQGSGLGLSMVLGSMEQLGGTAKLDNEPGRGTIVRLYLPRAPGHEPDKELQKIDPTPAASAERILLVEDNALIRSSVVTMLENLGYTVEEADTADMALAMVDRGARFDLVFTDILLPGKLSGVALARELRARNPATRILLTSGYAKPAHYQAEIEALGLEILVKPYRKALLSERVRAALDQKKT